MRLCTLLGLLMGGVCLLPAKDDKSNALNPFVFKDVGKERGLLPHVAGIRGHGVAWGDVDGNGFPELFVATFHNQGSKPSMYFRNEQGKFTLGTQETLQTSGIGSGALFVDLTNSGKLDLYVSNCAHGKEGLTAVPSLLFRNDGQGKFSDVSKDSGACLAGHQGRGLAALDADGDGLLDLLLCEQYYSPKVKTGPALLHNKGQFKFELMSEKAGLPVGLGGLGLAVGDFNNDTWPDLFLSSGAGDHRLYVNDGHGQFKEVEALRKVFRWEKLGREDYPAGVCVGDVNRDGRLDIVVGHHCKSPWTAPVPIRLYLNRGLKDGQLTFEDVTEAAGLTALPMKAPHVEIQDFDNDGWPDIYTSIVKFHDGQPVPMIFRNLGLRDGQPCFGSAAWNVNDFPTAEDKVLKQSTKFFEKVLSEKKIIYMAAAPTADFDRDGKLDMFLANWWLESPSLLLRNETPGGRWLDVVVRGGRKVNRMGVGSRVNVYKLGMVGKPNGLLAAQEIAIGYGFCSGQEARAHFGLGPEERVDVEVILPHDVGRWVLLDRATNQTLTLSE